MKIKLPPALTTLTLLVLTAGCSQSPVQRPGAERSAASQEMLAPKPPCSDLRSVDLASIGSEGGRVGVGSGTMRDRVVVCFR